MQTYRTILIFLLLVPLFAKDTYDFIKKCPIDYRVMYAIAKTENSYKNVGYPYIISFNTKVPENILEKCVFKRINKRSIDCFNESNCLNIAKKLINSKIVNIDLGAFQINYKYHKTELKNYFDLKKSYLKACEILLNIYNKYGWNWESVAKYHSYNKQRNMKYAVRLQKNIRNFIKEN